MPPTIRQILITVLLIASAYVDLRTTRQGLDCGLQELNPVAVGFIDLHGFTFLILVKAILITVIITLSYLAYAISPGKRRSIYTLLVGMAALVWAGAASWNAFAIAMWC